jgi:hypothetical protein
MTPVFLWSELHFLNFPDIFVDGTFSVCRNLEFAQIYIFSVNIQNSSNTKTFSYLFMQFLMRKRSKKNYEQILRFCKKVYFQQNLKSNYKLRHFIVIANWHF